MTKYFKKFSEANAEALKTGGTVWYDSDRKMYQVTCPWYKSADMLKLAKGFNKGGRR